MKTFCVLVMLVALGVSVQARAGQVKMNQKPASQVKSVLIERERNRLQANLKDGGGASFKIDALKASGLDPILFANALKNFPDFEVLCQTKNGADCEDGFVVSFGFFVK